jgi:hypothetical protein
MSQDINNRGPVYKAAFLSTAAAATPTDIFGVLASTATRVRIDEVVIGAISTADNADFTVQVLRGSTGRAA